MNKEDKSTGSYNKHDQSPIPNKFSTNKENANKSVKVSFNNLTIKTQNDNEDERESENENENNNKTISFIN